MGVIDIYMISSTLCVFGTHTCILPMDKFFSIICDCAKGQGMCLLDMFTPEGKCISFLNNMNSKTDINGNHCFIHLIFPDVYFSLT